MTLPDTAKALSNTGPDFAAFLNRSKDYAVIYIFPRAANYSIDFDSCAACYETRSKGASESARREIRKLEIAK